MCVRTAQLPRARARGSQSRLACRDPDRDELVNPPPYFPTTGRYIDNRYCEIDPVRFNPDKLFESLRPDP